MTARIADNGFGRIGHHVPSAARARRLAVISNVPFTTNAPAPWAAALHDVTATEGAGR